MENPIQKTLERIRSEKVQFVNLQFSDLFGTVHQVSIPASSVTKDTLAEGIPFDGSSIRAWQSIEKSDMILKPDLESAFSDPFRQQKTLCFFSNIFDPRTGQRYERDPRSILLNALDYLKSTGIGTLAYIGAEPEFFVFDGIRYNSEKHFSCYEIASREGPWSSMDEDSLGHKIEHKSGYLPLPPMDTLIDLRAEVCSHLQTMNVTPEIHHHEVASGGQSEIGTRFNTALITGDNINKLKYAVKNTAAQHGKSATFMPKPIFEDNGSGMHVHISLWKDNVNIFHGDKYSSLSETALYAIGGILRHGKAIQIFTNPTINSYRRLLPGYEAPVKLAYSATNRSAAIRIPYSSDSKSRRIEFRCPDASGSTYLTFAAIIMAAIDGIKNRIDPGQPIDKNLYNLPPEELQKLQSTSHDLSEAITAFYNDQEWLKAGSVFTDTMLNAYIAYKQEFEIEPIKLRPNPYEFSLYYHV
ncbi:glutamine synthetase [Spirochaetota bacterium]|nr:glutamine synthetase [Spirochaetota bacterium]